MRGRRQASQRMSLSQRRRLAGTISAVGRHNTVWPCNVTESVGRPVIGDAGTFVFDRCVWGVGSTLRVGGIVRVKERSVSRAPIWLYLTPSGTMSPRDAFWSEERPTTAPLPMESAD